LFVIDISFNDSGIASMLFGVPDGTKYIYIYWMSIMDTTSYESSTHCDVKHHGVILALPRSVQKQRQIFILSVHQHWHGPCQQQGNNIKRLH